MIFNPREQNWDHHFEIVAFHVLGRTPCGRATVSLLQMNEEPRVEARKELALSDEDFDFDEV